MWPTYRTGAFWASPSSPVSSPPWPACRTCRSASHAALPRPSRNSLARVASWWSWRGAILVCLCEVRVLAAEPFVANALFGKLCWVNPGVLLPGVDDVGHSEVEHKVKIFNTVTSTNHNLWEHLVTVLPQLLPALVVQLPGDPWHDPHSRGVSPQCSLQLLP